MRSKVMIFSGPFGGGKTETAVSITIPGVENIKRLILDPEMRADTYQSMDGVDHPEKHLFAFKLYNVNALRPKDFFDLMKTAHEEKWEEKPDMIGIDNAQMVQDMMFDWWKDKPNILATATLYGKEKDRALTAKSFRIDPGTISLFKSMFKYFLLDLKSQGIFVVITAPPHNVWKDYNKSGYDANGDPVMKVLGQTANVMDTWVQMTDVIWTFTRQEKKNDKTTLLKVPHVSMDMFNPKAALPGVPEQFEWPGWNKIWDWYANRTHQADVTKLQGQEASWSPEQEEEATKIGKLKFIKDLQGLLTLPQIQAIFTMPDTPAYTRNTHAQLLEYFKQVAKEQAVPKSQAPETPKTEAPEVPATEAPKAEPVKSQEIPQSASPITASRTVETLVTEAAQYGLKSKTDVFALLKKAGFKNFNPAEYDQYVLAIQTSAQLAA
jgi:hypothetical protein